MAKGGIQLDIGTNYKGEGFKKLDQDMKSASQSIKKVGGTVTRVANEFETLGGSAGKAAGKIGGIFASIAEGGVKMAAVTLIIQGAVKGIESLFNWLNKTNDAVKRVQDSFKDGLAIKKVNAEITKFGNTYQSVLRKKQIASSIQQNQRNEQLKRMELDREDTNLQVDGISGKILNKDAVRRIQNQKVENAKADITDIQNRIKWAEKTLATSQRNEQHTKNNWNAYNEASLKAGARGDQVAQTYYYNKSRDAKEEYYKRVEDTKKYQEELQKLKVEEIKAQEQFLTTKKAADVAIHKAEKEWADAAQKLTEDLNKIEAKKLDAEVKVKEGEKQQRLDEQKKELENINDNIKQLTNAVENAQNIYKNNKPETKYSPWQQVSKEEQQARKAEQLQQTRADQIAGRIFDRDGKVRKSTNSRDLDTLMNLVHNGALLDDNQVEGLASRRKDLQTKAGYTNKKMSKKEQQELDKLNDLLKGHDAKKALKEAEREKMDKEKQMIEEASQRTADIKEIKEKIKSLGL